jgi:uncharacterized membrane protein (UPF0127 family)
MKYSWIFPTILAVLAIVVFWFVQRTPAPPVTVITVPGQALPASAYATTSLVMGNAAFVAQIADTSALQQLGLSYRASMAPRDAMLFSFANAGTYQFWMKDMSFPLDIIWLSTDKHVIYIEKNLAPSTYPTSFGPTAPTQYVIEVAAGTADRVGLKMGDTVAF